MKTTAITPRGYCKGVVRAIQIAQEASRSHQPLYILGMIVHNEYIVNALTKLGAVTIDDPAKTRLELLDEIDEGTIIITAHGAGDQVFAKAKQKGLKVIDATCLDVIKTHDLIRDYLKQNIEVLYIGKKHHPEAEGALMIDERVHLIEKAEDFLAFDPSKRYVLTNQTTMSIYDVYQLGQKGQAYLPHLEIAQEICQATRIRQKAIAGMNQSIDVVFIVGDPHSNNTKKLAQIAREAGKETYMIESINDLDLSVLKGKQHAAVSSGASTPTYLTNQIISFLKQFDETDPATHSKPAIDYDRILK